MGISTLASLVDLLRDKEFLGPEQLEELERTLRGRVTDPATIICELRHRGWLTGYQATHLLDGRVDDLIVGQYLLLDLIGEGGMGQVYKARQRRLKRDVALKVIRKDRLKHPESVRRFRREVEAAARLSHPNIVTVYDADEVAGTHFLAMEYAEGVTLAQLVHRSGPLPIPAACHYIRQAALGLQHAHERGLVHRDIKPGNLLLTELNRESPPPPESGTRETVAASRISGTIKILDMGLARVTRLHEAEKTPSNLTRQGVVMGTPHYLAPEQAVDSRGVDIRADIYSLGCTLFHILTGRPPFQADSMAQVLVKHQTEEPPPLKQLRGDATPELQQVLGRMMAKQPENRYQTPIEVAQALEPFARPASSGQVPVPADVRGRANLETRPGPPVTEVTEVQTPVPPLPSPPAPRAVYRRPRKRDPATVMLGLTGVLLVGLLILLAIWQQMEAYREESRTLTNTLGMKFVLIPAGSFTMGSPATEIDRSDEEEPHEVTLTQPFYLGVFEVTQSQYQQVMGTNPSWYGATRGGGPTSPVENITWKDAVEFCRRLGEMPAEKHLGRRYRLPTEAEWEYACRAGGQTPFGCGESLTVLQANFRSQEPYPPTAPSRAGPGQPVRVGLYAPNTWGLYDMHGNVWEMCADFHSPHYYREGPPLDPSGPAQGKERVVRGGSWNMPGAICRSAFRNKVPIEKGYPDVGFRVVCPVPRPTPPD